MKCLSTTRVIWHLYSAQSSFSRSLFKTVLTFKTLSRFPSPRSHSRFVEMWCDVIWLRTVPMLSEYLWISLSLQVSLIKVPVIPHPVLPMPALSLIWWGRVSSGVTGWAGGMHQVTFHIFSFSRLAGTRIRVTSGTVCWLVAYSGRVECVIRALTSGGLL